jgi:predicted Zn-dependent protease
MFYLDTGKPGDALTSIMFVLRQFPGYREAYPMLAAAAIRNGTPQLGIMAMDGVIANRPYDAEAYAYLGSLYACMGRNIEARAALSRALELDPENSAAKRFMEQLQATPAPSTRGVEPLKSPALR